MKLIYASVFLGAALAQTCKPAIEPSTEGIEYEKLVDRFMEVKRGLDQIEKTEDAIADVEDIILNHGAGGLDSIMQQVRKLGLELKVKENL